MTWAKILLFCWLSTTCISPQIHANALPAMPENKTYWQEREELVNEDLQQMLGFDLTLSPGEKVVNDYLMKMKEEEINSGYDKLNFCPSFNFMKVKEEIDKSKIFRFIRQLPKGSALHLHDMALTSIRWVISELTYWNDLYICNSTDDKLFFRFFNKPDNSCSWKLVSEERAAYDYTQDYDGVLFETLSLYTTDIENTYPDINSVWVAFERVFTSVAGLISYDEAWKSYLNRALLEFMDDNVSYMEFRGVLPLLYDIDGKIYTAAETVGVYENVIRNFTLYNFKNFMGARFIYAPPRLVDLDTAWDYVALAIHLRDLYPSIFAGFDLVGQEDLGYPLTAFIEPLLYLEAQDPPLPLFFHAGETNWEGLSSDENLFDAILLNASRIGHGYAISKHPKLLEMARNRDIPIEVCPISNQVLKLVDDIRNHPAASLAANSFPMVVSSDDPAIWEALPLSHDFYEAFMGIGGAKADLRFLKKLALNSIKYSSLDPLQKLSLESMWEEKWMLFIHRTMIQLTLAEETNNNIIPTASTDNFF